MGCAASKLDNEDTVRRCKERRRLMKDAVYARHHLAAAHSDYFRSLRLTGSSLSSFAAGEPLAVSPHTPSVHVTPPPPRHVTPPPSSHATSPPPPPPHHTAPPPNPPATSTNSRRFYRQPNPIKLPHILSESSPSATPHSRNPKDFHPNPNFTYKADSTYSETASQTSSVWNWENFYPPSPPGSEFFENRNKKHDDKSSVRSVPHRNHEPDRASVYSDYDKVHNYNHNPQPNHHEKTRDDVDNVSVYSDFFDRGSSKDGFRSDSFHSRGYRGGDEHKVHSYSYKQQGDQHHLDVDGDAEEEGEETEREEVQYSEWDDHYITSSSSSEGEERESSRSEIRVPSSVWTEPRRAPPQPQEYAKSEKTFDDGGGSSASWKNDMRMVVRHRDLAEIVAAIREYFDKAAASGEQVSEMLETGRAQLDRSFSKLKKTVYHSSGVFSNLSSSWTSKPPLAVKYRFEPSSVVEPGGPKSLCSTLERLLAWEKKLYQEVKAREGVKIAHEKKLSSLQSQEYKGNNDAKLDKTKAEINKLQSLIVVTSQAVSTTSSAIIGVRDAELVPQLVELCHGFMYMWRSMNQFHEVQNQIVQQVRGLVNRSMKGESTSDLHRQATRDLESAVSAWHSSFCRLIKFQREFIRSLHGWFKLTLLPLNAEPVNGNTENSEAFSFYDEWKLALDRLPDTVASEAIKSFINVVHSISSKQTEELKIKKRTESASKELEKKSASLRNIEKKYYHSYSMVGIGLPDTGPDNGHVLDARDPLADKKIELESCRRRVEDEMMRHAKAVEVTRAMTLNNIQTGLPGVFQAMTSFSALVMEALETVCTRSYAIK